MMGEAAAIEARREIVSATLVVGRSSLSHDEAADVQEVCDAPPAGWAAWSAADARALCWSHEEAGGSAGAGGG